MMYSQIETPRGSFGVRLRGNAGETVVCVHGFPDDASTYDDLADALAAAGFRVAAVNLRGYHPSPSSGSLDYDDLVEDLAAVTQALSPDAPVVLIGHDYGAQLGYALLARWPHRYRRAVLISGAHPAVLQRNARRHPRQWWMSRYIVFFQTGRLADRWVARRDFAYIDRLWRRWSPGFDVPTERGVHIKDTLRASMPAPVAMYRAGGFGSARDPICVPTLVITGGRDGCALPSLADGQEALFTSGYEAHLWDDVGHYPHLEEPGRTAETVRRWIS
jgi:pimeloyl-ACP methyl ester carboxylesterase